MKKLFLYLTSLFAVHYAIGQAKIFNTNGTWFNGKITITEPNKIHYIADDSTTWVIYLVKIDSIIYENGRHEMMPGLLRKIRQHENIPQLNTWTFDQFGFVFLGFSQSYEHRLRKGDIGFRVPLYISWTGGGFAGMGVFNRQFGVYYPDGAIYGRLGNGNNYSIASGLNIKIYLFEYRVVRLFAGPEADMGYSVITGYLYNGDYSSRYTGNYPPYSTYRCGTFAGLASFGLMLNPVDKFNMTFHGAARIGDVFGSHNPVGWTGIWQIGFAIGTNF